MGASYFTPKRILVIQMILSEEQLKIEKELSLQYEQCFNNLIITNEKEMKQLEKWTGLKCKEIIFDSTIDNWSIDTSVLNERIITKKQLVFLIESEDGELFGYYLNTEVINEYNNWIETDLFSFEFNLISRNRRLDKPMKFEIINDKDSGLGMHHSSDQSLIDLGDIGLFKQDCKGFSLCEQYPDCFNYHGIENALCGNKPDDEGIMYFIPKRILVIQMN